MFNLISHRRELFEVYKKHCSIPHLGMTPGEFTTFLTVNQKMKDVDVSTVRKLITHHDQHNNAYKTTMANENHVHFQQGLFSYVSFNFIWYHSPRQSDTKKIYDSLRVGQETLSDVLTVWTFQKSDAF